MANFIDKAADDAATILFLSGTEVDYSILKEVLAGCLGYESFSALENDENNLELPYHLEDAEALVINVARGAVRATQLFGQSEPIMAACIGAIERTCQIYPQPKLVSPSSGFSADAKASGISVYLGLEDFYSRHGINAIRRSLAANEDLAVKFGEGWMAVGRFCVSNTLSHCVTENFWCASEYWTLRGDCTWQRPGHPGCSIDGLITYARAGRTGLIFDSQDFNVGNTHKLTVKLKIFTPEIFVQRKDGSMHQPQIALIYDPISQCILASAVSVEGDTTQLAMGAIQDSFRGSRASGAAGQSEIRQFVLDTVEMVDRRDIRAMSELCKQLGIVVEPARTRYAGRTERFISSMNKRIVNHLGDSAKSPTVLSLDQAIDCVANLKVQYNNTVRVDVPETPIQSRKRYLKS
ncbi:hypothetical protein [Pseudomonas sp. MWU318]|uniref:hypothetical protein n=1 Tax=Pseudomonas sp. MWU318 TaxID=2802569 RepID=UPI001928D87E|nr:hypothetical protein [Pseudomonas sp. MWU318]